jgi:glycosyltransferase involved in cell wall biosynthesis
MLVITGDGSAMEQVQALAKSEGVFNNMVFTGFISRPFLKHFYFIADIFVFASKIETQGMVVLESLACGTPVVAVGVMGIKEVMRGDNGGFMVEEDLKDFTKKVKMLLNDSVLYNQKVIETKEYIANWTMQSQAKKMTEIYNGLIA